MSSARYAVNRSRCALFTPGSGALSVSGKDISLPYSAVQILMILNMSLRVMSCKKNILFRYSGQAQGALKARAATFRRDEDLRQEPHAETGKESLNNGIITSLNHIAKEMAPADPGNCREEKK